jgi:hypothetical protein
LIFTTKTDGIPKLISFTTLPEMMFCENIEMDKNRKSSGRFCFINVVYKPQNYFEI